MLMINNTIPFLGILLCIMALIRVKYRTLELDSIIVMLLFIVSFTLLADADIKDNEFVPVIETVMARVIQVFIVLFVMSVIKRYTLERHKRITAEAKLQDLQAMNNGLLKELSNLKPNEVN